MIDKRRWIAFGIALVLLPAVLAAQAIPTPEAFFGHRIGAEKKLARWDRIVDYMRTVAGRSDRILLQEPGKTTNGNPFLLLIVSSPENLRSIERYKRINRRIFDPRTIASDEEARNLAREGKIFVLVTCSMHSTEVGATQMSIEAVHRLATDASPETRKILDNVIFLLVPCLNPDGEIMVTDWYDKTLGTPYEDAPLPWLYHAYTGHDNNRDAYMFTQIETRLIGKILYQDWLPEVWLDEHQMGSSGARIFVMPANDPINPNVEPVIYRYAGLLGFAQAAALERAGKDGIINADTYTYWWEGAMGWAGWWHNMIGMLTEVASVRTATSIDQAKADPSSPPPPAPAGGRGAGGGRGGAAAGDAGRPLPAPRDIQFRSQYARPWLGGRWTLRDIVDYDAIATFGLLGTAADLRSQILESVYTAGRNQIEKGRRGDPFAVVVPRDQRDRPTAVRLLQTLALGGVEVHQARKDFAADGKSYKAGDYVILMAQPFRGYAKDMLEAQDYPKIAAAPGLAPPPPNDVAGWSHRMQMGVETAFVKAPFEADLAKLARIDIPEGRIRGEGPVYLFSHEANASLTAVNRLLKAGADVAWMTEKIEIGEATFAPGAIVAQGGRDIAGAMAGIVKSLGIDAVALTAPPAGPRMRIRAPRTALYQPWGGNADEGWTRWLLEQWEFPFKTVHPEDLRKGGSAGAYDVIIFPDMSSNQILAGQTMANVPPEYKGGIEETGLKGLQDFVAGGGTIVFLGRSSQLAIDKFRAPFRDALQGVSRESFFCPGSVVRILVDNTRPLAFGMPAEADGYFVSSTALDAAPSFGAPPGGAIVMYPKDNILRSGWLQGESYLANKVGMAEVKVDKGRLVLVPLRVQNRAQTHGTFKLLFNAILTSAADGKD
jgi:hypothetical protein